MNSRMDKYYNSTKTVGKRSQKNAELYKQVSKQSIEDFNVSSNATVLSDNGTSIDLGILKDMLDEKYKEPKAPKRSLDLEFEEEAEDVKLDETKEYDINAILEKARENKTVDYDKERLKKIRDTQYDILKSLDLTKKETEEETKPTEEEEKLMTLINTITLNEANSKKEEGDADPLDLFKDLKGSENTQVIEGLKEDVQKKINTDKNKIKETKEEENQIDNSFYTKSLNLSKSDFEDFKDLEDEVKSNKVLVTILTIIIIIAFIAGIIFFLNVYFDWGLF